MQGYKGSAALKIALNRGEIEGACGMSHSTLKTQWQGEIEAARCGRWCSSVSASCRTSPVQRTSTTTRRRPRTAQIFDVAFGPHVLGRPLLAPPGVPAERVHALRTAFISAMRDAELLAEIRRHGLEIAPSSGEEVEALVARFASVPKSIIEKATAGMHEKR